LFWIVNETVCFEEFTTMMTVSPLANAGVLLGPYWPEVLPYLVPLLALVQPEDVLPEFPT
jgi:hypothetical protein